MGKVCYWKVEKGKGMFVFQWKTCQQLEVEHLNGFGGKNYFIFEISYFWIFSRFFLFFTAFSKKNDYVWYFF